MFWSRPVVSDDLRGWILECFDWFDEVFEPPEHPILPTRAFFSAPGGTGEETAKAVLEDVKRHLAFDYPVEIVPLDVIPAEHRHSYQALDTVAGTHQIIDGVSLIRYDPEKVNRPVEFISLIAHELMHARLAGLEHEVPGGYEAHELATDLGCIIAGFGVFQLQGADDVGWSGYMTQPSRAFALAVFLSRRGLGPDTVAQHLSPRCNRLLRRAFKDV
ncbi:hypothetical protein [Ruegeria sp.]|uniref:hypothetical protein n=1 Tax=Ruegeria sp. TaxID=1879320 RepID=UPI003B5914FE